MADEVKKVETAVTAEVNKKVATFGSTLKDNAGKILLGLGVVVAIVAVLVSFHVL